MDSLKGVCDERKEATDAIGFDENFKAVVPVVNRPTEIQTKLQPFPQGINALLPPMNSLII
jgi:hypothetical protein